MDGINPFIKNDFVSYPANYSAKQKTPLSVFGKDILAEKDTEINEEISRYIDILYSDMDDNDILPSTDKLKLNNAYAPMKSTKLHYGKFFI